jgi:2-methylisocitrate lyase-like PEP mutase family enzyme
MAVEQIPEETLRESNTKSVRLRELLQAPEILIMPGAFDVLSALLFQQMGFPAVQASSAGIANVLGYADLAIGRERSVQITGEMAAAISVPLNADGEDGFGGPEEVAETVRAYVVVGAAGMNMEDSKRDGEPGLVDLDYQLEKIAAFVETRRGLGSEFLLNARVDVLARMRDDPQAALAQAVRRGRAYAEAGADCVFFLRLVERDAIRTVVQEVPAPVSVLNVPAGPSVPELQELGVARVSFGSAFLYAAAGGVKRLVDEVRGVGTMTSLEGGVTPQELREALSSRRA